MWLYIHAGIKVKRGYCKFIVSPTGWYATISLKFITTTYLFISPIETTRSDFIVMWRVMWNNDIHKKVHLKLHILMLTVKLSKRCKNVCANLRNNDDELGYFFQTLYGQTDNQQCNVISKYVFPSDITRLHTLSCVWYRQNYSCSWK